MVQAKVGVVFDVNGYLGKTMVAGVGAEVVFKGWDNLESERQL